MAVSEIICNMQTPQSRASSVPPTAPLLASSAISCRGCSLRRICLPARLPAQEIQALEHAVERDRALAAGAALTHTGRRMQALYVLRSGSAKCFSVSAEGEELVRGFCLPGELIGLEGFAEHRDACDTVALEPARYCRIPLRRFELLMDILPSLRREIVRMLSQSLEASSRTRTRLVSTDARSRVAAFLLDLARRLEMRGISPREFDLSMSRRDIARHLGLTVETVSRELSSFKRAGWLNVRARQIAILAPEALASLMQ